MPLAGGPQSEEAFLEAIAQRPGDRTLRLVFADWLAEQGDERAEVITLGARDELSRAQLRRVARLEQLHARRWLGPLDGALAAYRFEGGFLAEARFLAGLGDSRWLSHEGEPRLGTVRTLGVSAGRSPLRTIAKVFSHPVLKAVKRLELDAEGAIAFKDHAPHFELDTLAVRVVHPEAQLTALSKVDAFDGVRNLELNSGDFMNPQYADELADALGHSGLVPRLDAVELVARFGTLEGSARWLLQGARRATTLKRVVKWAVGYGEALCGLGREAPRGPFTTFSVDAAVPGTRDVGARIASAASVLALLGASGLTRVEVGPLPGGRLRPQELDALRAACRRVSTIEALRVAGQNVALGR